ncbi:T-box transcription factor, putative [Actinidia rufa]|uniref:T-box transcription factor, putative n=1 Tax=Actinidia rufa TaxID=165716 RepID=A0A7J0H8A2_9ERIC|nr:T-box transcription factor, putative [Actinidia rufa]
MGTEIQATSYFSGSDSMRDLNDSAGTGIWALYREHNTLKNDQYYNTFLTRPNIDGYVVYDREQLRQTILKHESIFRHQEPIASNLLSVFMKGNNIFGSFPSQDRVKSKACEAPGAKCNMFEGRLLDLELPATEGKWLEESACGVSRLESCLLRRDCEVTRERHVSLCLGSGLSPGCNGESRCNTVPFSGGASPENSPALFKSLQVEPRKDDEPSPFLSPDKSNPESRRKRTIFGVEISKGGCDQSVEASPAPSPCPLIPLFDATKTELPSLPPWCKASSIVSQVCLDVKSVKAMNSSPMGGLPWLKENELVKIEPIKGQEGPHQLNPHSLKNPPLLFADKTETGKGPSQSLVRVCTASISACDAELEKTETCLCPSNSKTLEGPIFVPQTPTDVTSLDSPSKFRCFASDGDGGNDWKDLGCDCRSGDQLEVTDIVTEKVLGHYTSGIRHHIDLNLCMNEDEVPPVLSLPRAMFNIATTEIDLEVPAVLEPEASPSSEADSSEDQLKIPSKLPLDESNEHIEELVRVAAEAIIAIASSDLMEDITPHPLPVLSGNSLLWFAEVVSSNLEGELIDEGFIPDGMDYFEFMTLNLTETKVEENCSMFPCFQNQREEERGSNVLFKRPRRGQARRGRQRKDFQRDILPGLVSLSRHEVSEDFQMIEELFKATGLAWQPSRSQRNGAKKGRGRRRSGGSSPSLTPSKVCPSPVEQPICRELVMLEGRTLTGWGKRTRRLPRKRCPTDIPRPRTMSKSGDFGDLLQAAGHSEALQEGRSIHGYALRRGIGYSDEVFETSLVDVYIKCGTMNMASSIFSKASTITVASWNALIAGHLQTGQPVEALNLFFLKVQQNLDPDLITLANGIWGCADLKSMQEEYNVIPSEEHYGCMVDLLSRTGRIEKAYTLLNRLPLRQRSTALVALLAACCLQSSWESSNGRGRRTATYGFRPGEFKYLQFGVKFICRGGKMERCYPNKSCGKGHTFERTPGFSLIEDKPVYQM